MKRCRFYFTIWCPYCEKWIYRASDLKGLEHKKCGEQVNLIQYKFKKKSYLLAERGQW